MPRFSETEKENLRRKLKSEGERLFSLYGLKKVTIDDLIRAAGIAKASFYVFYKSKEHLFLDIVQNIQKDFFDDLENLLSENVAFSGADRVRQVFAWLSKNMIQRPILTQISKDTIEILQRKLPQEMFLEYFQNQFDAVHSLVQHGVRFKCSPEIASLAFQSVYSCWTSLTNEDASVQNAVISIVLDGVISQIVE